MESLLGQFYSRIKGSQEDIASEGLAYILQRSENARNSLYKFINNECGIDLRDLTFNTQDVGDNLERPDITGKDKDLKEKLIIEAKFWASLTDNQPNEYLKRLHESGSVLLFVCPSPRTISLFDEVLKRIQGSDQTIESKQDKNIIYYKKSIIVKITTWDSVLRFIRESLLIAGEMHFVSDIDQIIGFCNTIDNNTFMPLKSEELSPSVARRILSYNTILDKVVDTLKTKKDVNTKGLKAVGQVYGYTRYCQTNNLALTTEINYEHWAKHADTPFWIGFQESNNGTWITNPENILKKTKNIEAIMKDNKRYSKSGFPYFPLYPKINKTETEVIDGIVTDIIQMISIIEDA